MPPKARSKSPAPKPKAGKAKAAPKPEPEDPKVAIMKEAEEMFDKYSKENDGGTEVVKLPEFAQCIKDMNIRKCLIWGDDPGPVIREQFKVTGINSKRELTREDFCSWWPTFLELVQAKVEEVRKAEAEVEAKKKEAEDAMAAVYNSDGVWKITIPQLTEALDKAFAKGKTPLILDNTEGQRCETFFTYSGAHIIECKKMIVEKAKGSKVDDILEEVRDSFWKGNCFKYGQPVVFRLANTAIDVNVFHNETFPTKKLLDASEVAKVLGLDNAENFKGSPFYPMCMTDDQRTEHTFAGVKDKFRVVAISQFKEDEYEEFLSASQFPLDLMQPIKPE